MTRSNDPFEDLPEWKERRRLQEAQEMRQRAAHDPEAYPESHAAVPHGYGQAYDAGGHGQGGPAEPAWNEHPVQPGIDPAHGGQNPTYQGYEQQGYAQGFQEAAPGFQHDGYSAEQVPPSAGWAPSAAHANPALNDQGFRGGPYDEPQLGVPPELATNASLDDYRPDAGPARDEQLGAPPPFFGAAGGHGEQYAQADYRAPDDEAYDDDEYDYDYEDEDDEESRGYGWKMVAGLVVVGAVVAGGGFFLYDTLGGGGSGGPAPIIKAERGPAKTAPEEPGGRSFANQDSKLLGRLDSGNGATTRTALDDDGRNRVREVPTVRVSPDGRLILPKATEKAGSSDTAAAPSVPGINIVDNLSGSRSGLGGQGLPAIVPKVAKPQGQPLPRTAVATPASSPSAPIIRNRRDGASPSGNLATARGTVMPPVPQKSAISSGWRMTGAAPASAPRRPNVVPRRTASAATTTASTLGASSVARQSARGFVAVIATKSSRMAALQSFAELQQRHPGTLSNRVPSVQKADLSARGLGTMYRLLVGPTGSRQAANEVCASLKAGGYSGCWVKAN